MKPASTLLGLILFALALPAGSNGEPVVDQQCLPEFWGYYSIAGGTPMGQEFVPEAGALGFVDLFVINTPASNNDTARVFVVIRADSIAGPELAASMDVAVPKPHEGPLRFEFPAPLPLEPGRTYVIEARRSAGPGYPALLWGNQAGACPGVTGFWLGRPFLDGGDFWYRTGYDPTPVQRTTWGTLKRAGGRPSAAAGSEAGQPS